MGLVHTPRVIAAVARGYWRHRMEIGRASTVAKDIDNNKNNGTTSEVFIPEGFGPLQPHVYHARVNMFDVDYLGHMNNAAYLAHAELARWEWVASNGMLSSMIKNNIAYYVSASTIRYRREIRPLYRKFQVQSHLCGLDDQHLWIYQTFRYPIDGNDRIRAQYLLQGVVIQGRNAINPKDYFINMVGLHPSLVEDMSSDTKQSPTMQDMIHRFDQLDLTLRDAAAQDDQDRSSTN